MDASLVKADASRLRHHEDDDWGGGSPAIRDYLDGLQEDDKLPIKPPSKVSQSDPQARWTAAYRRCSRQRKQVEMLFAHMKRVLKVDRLRLRGLKGAQDEFLLTATAQNLRRMAKYLGTDPPVVPEMA